jgi:hypothetical protein
LNLDSISLSVPLLSFTLRRLSQLRCFFAVGRHQHIYCSRHIRQGRCLESCRDVQQTIPARRRRWFYRCRQQQKQTTD